MPVSSKEEAGVSWPPEMVLQVAMLGRYDKSAQFVGKLVPGTQFMKVGPRQDYVVVSNVFFA